MLIGKAGSAHSQYSPDKQLGLLIGIVGSQVQGPAAPAVGTFIKGIMGSKIFAKCSKKDLWATEIQRLSSGSLQPSVDMDIQLPAGAALVFTSAVAKFAMLGTVKESLLQAARQILDSGAPGLSKQVVSSGQIKAGSRFLALAMGRHPSSQ